MADNVEIRGGGDFDGAVLRNAATESTLKRLADTFDKKFGSGSGSKIFEVHEKAVKNNVTAVEKSTSASDAYTKAVKENEKQTNEFSKRLKEVGSFAIGGIFSGIAAAGKILVGFFTDSLDSFRQTSNVGATFNNDLVLLRKTAAEAAMPLDMFTETIGKNSQLLAAFGGTVTQGAQRFAGLSKELRTGDLGTRFMGMGMTMGDLNEYMAGYLELEMRAGRLQKMTDAQLLQGTNNYILELDKLTKITGLSRQQQAEALRTALKDGRLQFLQNRLTGQAAEQFRSSIGLMQSTMDPQAMGTMTNMMMGIVEPGDKFGEMLMGTVPGIMQFYKAVGEGTVSTEEQIEAYKKQKQAIDARLSLYSREVIGSTESLKKMQEFSTGLESLINANAAAATQEQKDRKAVTEALGSIGQTFQRLKSQIELAFLNSGVFGLVEDGMTAVANIFLENKDGIAKALAEIMTGFTVFTDKFIKDIKEFGLKEALGKLFDGANLNIGGFIGDMIVEIFKRFMPSLDTLLIGAAVGIVTLIKAPIIAPFLAIGAALTAMFGYEKVKEYTIAGWEALKNLGTNIANFFSWDSIKGFFSGAWKSITDVPSKITSYFKSDAVGSMFSSAWDSVTSTSDKITGLFKSDAVGSMFSSAWDSITNTSSKITGLFKSDVVTSMFNSVWESITDIPNKIKAIFSGEVSVEDMFKSAIDTIFFVPNTILKLFNMDSVSTLFSNAWDNIKNIPDKIMSYFNLENLPSVTDLFNDFTTKIKSKFNLDDIQFPSIPDLFSNLIDKIKKFFTFDIQVPDFSEFLPKWMGGKGRPLSELTKSTTQVAAPDAQSNLTSGMQAPSARLTANSQNLSTETTIPARTTSQVSAENSAKLDSEVMIETLKKMDGVLVALVSNSPTQEQSKQLNTLIEQLVAINKQQLEANQDLVKATKGSYNPI